jgi:UDP-2-acetamido-3-amino-2,3-dideoxy-glucuronate N-acetyltransferase
VTDRTAIFVHPMGLCESNDVGPGTRIWAFAHVLAGASVGSDCNIGDHAYIEGGARLGSRVTVKNAVLVWDKVTVADDVFLGPNVVFTNDLRPRSFGSKDPATFLPTRVERGATIGANATIVCGVTVGQYAFVAAGAVVNRDVPPHALVAGNPGRTIGFVCRCGLRLKARRACACSEPYVLDEAGDPVPALRVTRANRQAMKSSKNRRHGVRGQTFDDQLD